MTAAARAVAPDGSTANTPRNASGNPRPASTPATRRAATTLSPAASPSPVVATRIPPTTMTVPAANPLAPA